MKPYLTYRIVRDLDWPLNTSGVEKKCDFRTESPFISEMETDIGSWLLLWTTNMKSWITYRSVPVPVTLKGGKRGFIFLADLRHYARMVWRRKTKFGKVTQMGRSMFLGVSHTTISRCLAQRPPNFGSPYIRPHEWHDWLRVTKFGTKYMWCMSVFLGWKPRPTSHSVGAPESPISVSLWCPTVWPKMSKFGMVWSYPWPCFQS